MPPSLPPPLTTQGDTLQGVAQELDRVLKSGQYCFVFHSGPDGVASTIELDYCPLAIGHQDQISVLGVEEADGGVLWATAGGLLQVEDMVRQRWNEEQISDFVRKLGFLDTRSESDEREKEDPGEQINRFLHLNQVSGLTTTIPGCFPVNHQLPFPLLPSLSDSVDRQEATGFVLQAPRAWSPGLPAG